MPAFIGGDDVVVVLNGAPFVGWVEVTVTQSFDKAAGDGKLKITEMPEDPFPAKIGDQVVVLCAGQPVLTGMVYSVDGGHDVKDHSITLTLRDKTQDLVDSTLGPKHENKPPVTLKEVAQRTVGKMGVPVGVIDKAGPDPYREAEVPVGDIEMGGHEYLDTWAQKRQCVLNTDGKGNLVIDQNKGRSGPGILFKARDADHPMNNVLKAQYKNSLNDRHNRNAASGQKSPNDKKHWESRPKGDQPAQAKQISKHYGLDDDTEIPSSRRKHFRARAGIDHDSPKKAAKWRSNVAKARGFQYIATVQGFEAAPGALWWHGVIIPVRDDHFLISDRLFVTQVKFHKTLKGGATTEVVCTFKDAYSSKGASESGGGRTGSPGIGSSSAGAYEAPPVDDYME